MKNKQGFTLIELLAVIVILAIIALIITPIITGVIKKAKDSSDLRSAEAYVKAGENYYAKALISGGVLDTNVIDDLEVSSKKEIDGSSVVVNSDGSTDMAIIINDKCYRKTFSEGVVDIKVTDITTDEDRNNCSVPLKSDYAILAPTPHELKEVNGTIYLCVYHFGIENIGGVEDYTIENISQVSTAPTTYNYSFEISDTSIKNNSSIMAYLVSTGTNSYNMFLVSNKTISAPIDSSYMFSAMKLSGDIDLSWINTYFVTNMNSMFLYSGTENMTSLKLGQNFYTSNVTDMSNMFKNTGFNKMITLDLGENFDTSSVINMSTMFENTGYKAMTTLKLGANFNPVNVTDMSNMFENTGYNKMVTLDLGENFNPVNVTDMSNMFESTGHDAMTTLNLGDNFNAKSAIDMSYMFYNTGDQAMTSLDLGNNFNAESATNMSYMFAYVGKNATINLGNNFNSRNVTDMSNMFYGNYSVKQIDLGANFDTSSVTNMSYMFYNAGYSYLTSLDLGDKFDTSNVTDMSYMFGYLGSENLTTFNLGDKFDTSNVTNMDNMFDEMAQDSKTFEVLDLGDKFDTSNVTNMKSMFNQMGRNSLKNLSLGDKFNTSKVTDMRWMFDENYAMEELDLGPAFKNITSDFTLGSAGYNSTAFTIKVSSDIYSDAKHFKLNKDSTTTISVNDKGTLINTY